MHAQAVVACCSNRRRRRMYCTSFVYFVFSFFPWGVYSVGGDRKSRELSFFLLKMVEGLCWKAI